MKREIDKHNNLMAQQEGENDEEDDNEDAPDNFEDEGAEDNEDELETEDVNGRRHTTTLKTERSEWQRPSGTVSRSDKRIIANRKLST